MNLDFLHNPRFWDVFVLALFVAIAVWIWLGQGAKISRFVSETGAELKKCSWPWNPAERGAKKYKELIDSTLVVAISSLLLAGFVTSSDFLLVKVIGAITRLR